MKRDKICTSNKFVSVTGTYNFHFAGLINHTKAVRIAFSLSFNIEMESWK